MHISIRVQSKLLIKRKRRGENKTSETKEGEENSDMWREYSKWTVEGLPSYYKGVEFLHQTLIF